MHLESPTVAPCEPGRWAARGRRRGQCCSVGTQKNNPQEGAVKQEGNDTRWVGGGSLEAPRQHAQAVMSMEHSTSSARAGGSRSSGRGAWEWGRKPVP